MRWELFLGIFQKLNYFFIYYLFIDFFLSGCFSGSYQGASSRTDAY